MQNEFARETTTPYRRERSPPAGERDGCSSSEGSTPNTTKPPSTQPSETPSYDPNSPTQDATAAPPTGWSQTEERPLPASLKGEERDKQLLVVGGLGPTDLRGASTCADMGGPEIANDQQEREVMSDSPITIAKLHLALESLARPEGGKGDSRLDSSECAQFCTEWPRDCQLPKFFDRTLLEPAWSFEAQVPSENSEMSFGLVRRAS